MAGPKKFCLDQRRRSDLLYATPSDSALRNIPSARRVSGESFNAIPKHAANQGTGRSSVPIADCSAHTRSVLKEVRFPQKGSPWL